MAININSLSKLITEFRALQTKDSVSPDSLGYILSLITELFNECISYTELHDVQSSINDSINLINSLSNSIKTTDKKVDKINDSIGNYNGIATLDEYKLIPLKNLPDFIIEFDDFVSDVEVEMSSAGVTSSALGASVVFDNIKKRFLLLYKNKYFSNWNNAYAFGILDVGIIPRSGRLYICKSKCQSFWYNGETLIESDSKASPEFVQQTIAELQNSIGISIFPLQENVLNLESALNDLSNEITEITRNIRNINSEIFFLKSKTNFQFVSDEDIINSANSHLYNNPITPPNDETAE